jgi:hypothetical protein
MEKFEGDGRKTDLRKTALMFLSGLHSQEQRILYSLYKTETASVSTILQEY